MKSGHLNFAKTISHLVRISQHLVERLFPSVWTSFINDPLTILCFKWSVKEHCITRISIAIWQIFFMKINFNSYKFRCRLAFIHLFCHFIETKNKNEIFRNMAVWLWEEFPLFCLNWVALFFKYIPNSIDLYKTIFYHEIPDCL